jgi:aminopeptidase N
MESAGIAYVTHDIIEEVIVHEVGHQWFFNMIGNDQYDESFLDESLDTFIVAYYYDSLAGIDGYNGYLESRNSLNVGFKGSFATALGVDLRSNVDVLGDNYAFAIYYHGPTLFKIYISEFMNNNYMEFLDIIKIYFNEFNGKTATIDAFLNILQRETNIPNTISWFNEQLEHLQNPLV